MFGESCGTLPKVTGWENVTEMVVFDGTFWAPDEGVTDLTKKPESDALEVPPEPEWPDDDESPEWARR